MPPKLRKEKSTPGTKSGSSTTNMFGILSDEASKQSPAKTTHEASIMTTPHQPPSPTRLDSMQNDIKSMVSIINTLSHSFHKMDKLDEIESHQKSSEDKIAGMIDDLRSEFETLKTSTTSPPTYADILNTTEKQNKNISATPSSTPILEIITPHQTTNQMMSLTTPNQTILPTNEGQDNSQATTTKMSSQPHEPTTYQTTSGENMPSTPATNEPTNNSNPSAMTTTQIQQAPTVSERRETTGLNQIPTPTVIHTALIGISKTTNNTPTTNFTPNDG